MMSFDAKYRILVTGSRGKSSLVRLLFAGMAALGMNAYGRITGVLPRELSRDGERVIVRNSPGHVEEMRWWLGQIPSGAEAIIMENSAVSKELQPLAARWLRPSLIVLTNAREDHQERWGGGQRAAEEALLQGIPEGVPVILSEEAAASRYLTETFKLRNTKVIVAAHSNDFRLANISLARSTLEFFGLSSDISDKAMDMLTPDIGDFRVFHIDASTALATAFSANDITSTKYLFSLLGWKEEETLLLFSDRADRPGRRASFEAFLKRDWGEVRILKHKEDLSKLCQWMSGKQVFGCGNIAGAPLELMQLLMKGRCKWTMPDA